MLHRRAVAQDVRQLLGPDALAEPLELVLELALAQSPFDLQRQ